MITQEILTSLRRYALTLTRGDQARAEDLVQDAAVKIVVGLQKGKFREGTNFRAWSSQIMYRLYCTDWKRRQRYLQILESFKAPQGSTQLPTQDRIGHDLAKMMKDLAHILSATQFQVLVCVLIEGLSYPETAERLNIPLGTVMSGLHRAKRKSRELIVTKYPEFSDFF